MARIEVKSEITGTVWKLTTQPGDRVEEGDTLIIIESMKMEIPVITEDGGTVQEILVKEKDPVAERQLGCSGATASRLVRVNDSLAVHSHADADEVLYIIAGEATLKLGDKEQTLAPGWFSLVPRGMSHSLTKRGRGPVLLLSSVSGPPCQ